jgi:hypothetical protein
MVVAGEPPRRHVRLVDRHDLVVAGDPVGLPAPADPPGATDVRHDDVEGLAGGQGQRGRDLQLVPVGPRPRRLDAVDRDRAHGQQQVEVERRQRLGGGDRQPGPAAESPAEELVAVVHLVAQHVDAAVAVEREVAVADAGGAASRCRLVGQRGRPQAQGHEEEGQGHDERREPPAPGA